MTKYYPNPNGKKQSDNYWNIEINAHQMRIDILVDANRW